VNIGDLCERAACWYGDRIALVDGERTRTFRELDERSNRLARVLLGRGLAPGDRVAVLVGNCLEWFDATYGIAKAGLVRTYVNPRLTPPDIAFQLQDADAAALVLSPEFTPVLDGLDGSAPSEVLATDDTLEALLADATAERPSLDIPGDALCALMYSSGTTGRPKGVLQTHSAWLGLGAALTELGIGEDDVALHIGPLSHAAGGLAYLFLARGATQVIHSGFDPPAVLDAIERRRVSATVMVPTMIYVLLDLLERQPRDMSSLRVIQYGGAPIAPDRLEQCLEAFGPVFTQGYGLTENLICTLLPRSDHLPGRDLLASAGRPLFQVELEIRADDGKDLAPREVGEITVRSPYSTRGYWNRPEDTAALIDPDGWVHTGDLGYLDERGYLFLVDRKNDMVVSGGFNVYPREVEDVLMAHPDVAEVAVVSSPDETWGETVTAVVRLRHAGADPAGLEAWCRERLAGYKVPRRWELIGEELPKNANGKVLRRVVKERFWAGTDRRVG
jgi:acyl-CoA synthetase (AMP-forming)/AMP-acid ligase II